MAFSLSISIILRCSTGTTSFFPNTGVAFPFCSCCCSFRRRCWGREGGAITISFSRLGAWEEIPLENSLGVGLEDGSTTGSALACLDGVVEVNVGRVLRIRPARSAVRTPPLRLSSTRLQNAHLSVENITLRNRTPHRLKCVNDSPGYKHPQSVYAS